MVGLVDGYIEVWMFLGLLVKLGISLVNISIYVLVGLEGKYGCVKHRSGNNCTLGWVVQRL